MAYRERRLSSGREAQKPMGRNNKRRGGEPGPNRSVLCERREREKKGRDEGEGRNGR